jgi:DGQHR domain-containing protein
MSSSLTLEAVRFRQAGRTFYYTLIPGRVLITPGTVEIDKWTLTNPTGYQRDPSQKRMNKITSFLKGDLGVPGVLPQSVLLGLRGQGVFTKLDVNPPSPKGLAFPLEFGTLQIPPELLPLWEDDGQHRIGGLRTAAESDPKFLDYPLPAVIMEDSTPLTEAVHFWVINTTSVKVPVDLAQRLIAQQHTVPEYRKLLVQQGKDWIARATEICDLLNGLPNQPWEEYIVVPNTDSDAGVKQNTIVRSLRPLLTGDHIYKNQDADTLAQLLVRYWSAMAEVWPSAVAEGTRDDFSLMKSSGVLTMHALAPQVFEVARASAGKVTQEALRRVLEPVAKNLNEQTFWDSKTGTAGRVGTNNKGIRILMDQIAQHLRASELTGSLL